MDLVNMYKNRVEKKSDPQITAIYLLKSEADIKDNIIPDPVADAKPRQASREVSSDIDPGAILNTSRRASRGKKEEPTPAPAPVGEGSSNRPRSLSSRRKKKNKRDDSSSEKGEQVDDEEEEKETKKARNPSEDSEA